MERWRAGPGPRALTLAVCILSGATASGAGAQVPQVPLPGGSTGQLEIRADVRWSGAPDVTGALGWSRPVNRAVRAGAIVGGGAERDVGGARWAAVAEAHVRFHLDPLAERPWGWYGVAGLGGRLTASRPGGAPDARAYLLLLAGVEGPPIAGRWRAALEAGLGDGARMGLVLRRARSRAR